MERMSLSSPLLPICKNWPMSLMKRRLSSTLLPSKSKANSIVSSRSDEEIYAYWSAILRAEEEALEKTRPWKRLDFIPAQNFKRVISTFTGEFLHKNYKFLRRRYDEKRALMDKDAFLLHYPFGPATQPKGLDPAQWNEAFGKARLFLLGTQHDRIASTHSVRLMLGAVHADFVLLGLSQPQSELLIAANQAELEPKLSKRHSQGRVVERLKKEGIELDESILDRISIRAKIKRIHTIYQYGAKFMVRWSEFAAAADYLDRADPECAGFVLGLDPEERLDRLVDSAEDFLTEEIVQKLSPSRTPRFGEDMEAKMTAWVEDLYRRSHYRSTTGYKYRAHTELGNNKANWERRPIDDMQDFHQLFDEFVDEEFPGFRAAQVARQNRQLVRSLHTLMHRGIVEKLCAAEVKRIPLEKIEPLTITAIVGFRHLPGIREIWDRPEEVYTGASSS